MADNKDMISENFSKKDRPGRPPAGGREWRSVFDGLSPGGSKRTKTNNYYAQRAFSVLRDIPECAWLFELRKDGNWKRKGLQVELGRIPWDDVMIETAKVVCQQKPKVKDGVIYIRQYRLSLEGKERDLKGDPDRLLETLRLSLNDFLLRYPDTDIEDIASAIGILKVAVIDTYQHPAKKDKCDLCTLGIIEAANNLLGELEAYDLPDDYSPGDLTYSQVIASVRHEYTNYEYLLSELPLCAEYIRAGGYCPHASEIEGEECPLVGAAHDTLKWAAKEKAEIVYQKWLEAHPTRSTGCPKGPLVDLRQSPSAGRSTKLD